MKAFPTRVTIILSNFSAPPVVLRTAVSNLLPIAAREGEQNRQVGEPVLAQWSSGDLYDGTIVSSRKSDGTYGVQFFDGDFDASVPEGRISLLPPEYASVALSRSRSLRLH